MLKIFNGVNFLDTILNVIFPVHCVLCGKEGSDLCLKCLSSSPPALRESANWIFPLFDYRHPPIKKFIWLLKYKGKNYKVPKVLLSGNHKKIEEWRNLTKEGK